MCLFPTGYDLSPKALTVLFNRFAKKRSYMNLDDFAASLSRVKIMDGELTLHKYPTWLLFEASLCILCYAAYACPHWFPPDTFKRMSRGASAVHLSKDDVSECHRALEGGREGGKLMGGERIGSTFSCVYTYITRNLLYEIHLLQYTLQKITSFSHLSEHSSSKSRWMPNSPTFNILLL